MSPCTRDSAVHAAELGFPIFKLRPDAVKPPPEAFYAIATADPTRAFATWSDPITKEPLCDNIGVACDRLLVVDVDVKNKKPGYQSLQTLIDDHGLDTCTYTVSTPSGGRHLYYRLPVGARVRGSVGEILPGIDIRSWHNYVVAAGSSTLIGTYECIDDKPVLLAPDWLIRWAGAPRDGNGSGNGHAVVPGIELDQVANVQRARDWLGNNAPEAIQGQGGDDATYKVAACVKDFGVSESVCLELMLDHWNETKALPCWAPDELAVKVGNAYSYGKSVVGVASAEAEFEEVKKKRRFELVPINKVPQTTGSRYLIKNLIPDNGLVLVWGARKSGKSFWTGDVMVHVALGRPYRGRKVKQGPVVYVAMEGHGGYGDRLAAMREQYGIEAGVHVPFYLLLTSMKLVADRKALVEEIRDQVREGGRPASIVLDTLNRSISGSESSDEDMSEYIAAADALWNAFKCVVIIVHHSGWDQTRPRGHTALGGAVEAQIAVARVGDRSSGKFDATLELMKDGREGDVLQCRLDTVQVGTDDDGQPKTTCIVQARGGDEFEQIELTPAEDEMWEAFQVAAKEKGEEDNWRTTVITTEEWDAVYLDLYKDEGENVNKGDVPSHVPSAKSVKQRHRYRTSIRDKGHIKKLNKGKWVMADGT